MIISGFSVFSAPRVAQFVIVPQEPDWLFRDFGEGLEIARPLKPLNTLKPLMNNNLFVGGDNDGGGLAHHSTLFDQRRQRPSAASAAIESANFQFSQIRDSLFRNLGIDRPLKPLKRAEAADITDVINEVINRFHHRTDRPVNTRNGFA